MPATAGRSCRSPPRSPGLGPGTKGGPAGCGQPPAGFLAGTPWSGHRSQRPDRNSRTGASHYPATQTSLLGPICRAPIAAQIAAWEGTVSAKEIIPLLGRPRRSQPVPPVDRGSTCGEALTWELARPSEDRGTAFPFSHGGRPRRRARICCSDSGRPLDLTRIPSAREDLRGPALILLPGPIPSCSGRKSAASCPCDMEPERLSTAPADLSPCGPIRRLARRSWDEAMNRGQPRPCWAGSEGDIMPFCDRQVLR